MKKKTHRIKRLSFVLALLFAFSAFAACGDKDNNYSTDDSGNLISKVESAIDDVSSNVSSVIDDVSDDLSEDFSDVSSDISIEDIPSTDVSDDISVPDESGTETVPDEPEVEPVDAFPFSGIDDVTDDSCKRSYIVYAPYTDKYTLSCENTKTVAIYEGDKKLKSGNGEFKVSLKEGKIYTVKVETHTANKDFKIRVAPENHAITLPYDVADPIPTAGIDLYGNGEDPLKPAEVNYVKRQGGTYIYSNNPEQFRAQHVGKAFMRNDGLTGEVYVTFEHANYSGSDAYLGYQLKNNGDHDVYITVTNVGYQYVGTWFGQLAWYKFYNTSFKLPADYLNENGTISSKYSGLDYAYREFNPRAFQPITYRLPAGEYVWIIGGTSADSYRSINVDGSANMPVNNIRCANGNVKFTVTGGEVTGTMYCYKNASQIADDPAPLGYVADGFAAQYSGIAHHHGVIDNYMSWTFNDESKSSMLPVTYTTKYANSVPSTTTPYAEYNSIDHVVNAKSWMTHLNPQNNHQAVGMDMVEFIWHDQNGNPIVIDNHHADGAGAPANTANWMIEYQDHFTFVNQGDTERKVTLHLRDHGTLAISIFLSVGISYKSK